MEMGSLTQRQYSDNLFQQTKGFKENPREILYLRWVNYKCGVFTRKKLIDQLHYEDVFVSSEAKELISIFKNFLKVKKQHNFQNFNNINFRLSSVVNIFNLKCDFYYLMCEKLYTDFVLTNDDFHDFFESFIVFTHRIFLKRSEEEYENDIYEYRDDEFDIDGINEIINSSDSDSD